MSEKKLALTKRMRTLLLSKARTVIEANDEADSVTGCQPLQDRLAVSLAQGVLLYEEALARAEGRDE